MRYTRTWIIILLALTLSSRETIDAAEAVDKLRIGLPSLALS